MFWWLLGAVVVTVVMLGVIYVTIRGIITKPKLKEAMRKNKIKKMTIERAQRSSNKMTLTGMNKNGEKVTMQVTGDGGIARGLQEGKTVRRWGATIVPMID